MRGVCGLMRLNVSVAGAVRVCVDEGGGEYGKVGKTRASVRARALLGFFRCHTCARRCIHFYGPTFGGVLATHLRAHQVVSYRESKRPFCDGAHVWCIFWSRVSAHRDINFIALFQGAWVVRMRAHKEVCGEVCARYAALCG